MAKKAKISKIIVYSSLYEVLVIIVPLIVSPHVSRALGVEGIGVYSFSLAVANYFKRASMLGVLKFGNRSIAFVNDDPRERRSSFWTIYTVQACATLLCVLIYSGYVVLFARDDMPAIIQYLYILASLFTVSWYFHGREEFRITVVITSIFKLLYLVGSLTLIKDHGDVNLYIALFALSYLLPSLILFIIAVSREHYVKPTLEKLKPAIKGMLILFIPVIAVTIYKSMDKLMLGIICDTPYENGIYENSEKILHVPIALISAVSAVLMPRMTVLFRDSAEKKANTLILRTVKYSAFVSVACAFGLAAVSTMFAVVYWGQDFYKCGELLTTFAISIPFMSFAEILRTQYIIPKKHDKIYIVAVCGAAVINLIINSILIPKIGAEGAVIGTVASEGAVCIYQAFMVRRDLPVVKYALQYVKFSIPGAVMYAVLQFLRASMKNSVLHLIELVALGAVIYVAVYLLYMVIFERKQLISAAQKIAAVIKHRSLHAAADAPAPEEAQEEAPQQAEASEQ